MQTEEAPGAERGEVMWRVHVNSDLVDVRQGPSLTPPERSDG